MANYIKALLRNSRGATSIEYALIAGFLSIMIVAGAMAIGNQTANSFSNVTNGFNATP
jgi:pilus assembly protein Flp/PilA